MNYHDAPRFQEQREEEAYLIIGTYSLENLVWVRPSPFDQVMSQDEVSEGHFAIVEFDLERAPYCEAELMRVRAYRTCADQKAGKQTPISAGLQEVFSQYLQDDKARWLEACDWLDAMGEPIGVLEAA